MSPKRHSKWECVSEFVWDFAVLFSLMIIVIIYLFLIQLHLTRILGRRFKIWENILYQNTRYPGITNL